MTELRADLGEDPAAAALDAGTVVRQLSIRELTYRRFRSHPIAKWALLLLAVIVAACYGASLWHHFWPDFIQAPSQFTLTSANEPPSFQHLFGTDSLNGHDIFSLVLYGGRISLFIGLGSMIVGMFIAIVVGSVAGYFGGIAGALLMRIADINYAIPVLLTVPLATHVFGHTNVLTIAVIFGAFSWPGPSRIVRSSMLSLKERQFAESARSLGVPTYRIIYRHLLPNAIGPILVSFTLGIASNIILEAFVSYLGFGFQPPTYSWGSVMSSAQEYMLQGNWWWITFPGLTLVLTVICVNFIGDGLRDAFDPSILR
ncbi:MAG: ABC transporter permease [Candidatus Dormibacteraceae bacterium]